MIKTFTDSMSCKYMHANTEFASRQMLTLNIYVSVCMQLLMV